MSDKRLPRWPLLLIAAPAAVAVWSGWVGLGGMCGFGEIRPLPGIWDAAHLNTAITLPVGVEAYDGYALRAWLTPGTSERARKFAKISAIGSLALGMLGQVVYHLLAAAHAMRAPWPVTTLVACLPVVALALGTALAHLLGEPGEAVPMEVTTPTREEAAVTVAGVPGAVPAGVPEIEPVAVPGEGVPPAPAATVRAVASGRARGRAPKRKAQAPETVFAAEIEAGTVPSLRAIKAKLHVGTDRARVIRDDLARIMGEHMPEAA